MQFMNWKAMQYNSAVMGEIQFTVMFIFLYPQHTKQFSNKNYPQSNKKIRLHKAQTPS